jgi:tetratricopeptide (TPR) repeat protein
MSVGGFAADELAALAQLGSALLAEGRIGEARLLWEGLAQVAPGEEMPLRLLALIATQERRWSDAEVLAAAAIERQGGAAAWSLRAEARWRMGRYAEAAQDLEVVVRIQEGGAEVDLLRRRARALLVRLRRPGAGAAPSPLGR